MVERLYDKGIAGTDVITHKHNTFRCGLSRIFSAKDAFNNCLRLNYGHAWDEHAEQALTTLGRLSGIYQRYVTEATLP
ncbi:hypothetical protein CR155_03605 [Pollutimonas nitritireducens]|uniref:Uncharacterized protein n=1 Tax=Pollutimonas nitritireducens TaxID=2045209 RepID=A0A2N4UJW9_9BURK|nr:hypothetical protein CR155_03605 [Pollutimonas nitritireducens]